MFQLASTVALFLAVAVATPTFGGEVDLSRRHATAFWYPNMDHAGPYRGYAPDVDGAAEYQVYRAVRPADGQGIQEAINDDNGQRRHGQWLASQPRVVYIPPGTYELNKTLYMNTDTILMGDAIDPPVLKAAAGFSGTPILVSGTLPDLLADEAAESLTFVPIAQDPATGELGERSFAVGLKNLVLDTTNIPGGNGFTALYWGVAQGAQLQNMRIVMATPKGDNGHSGIHLGRGSTLGLSDVRVEYGLNGIWHDGHQQAAYKNIQFYKNKVGMLISAGNTITIMGSTFDSCGAGVRNTGGTPWIAVVDCTSINSGVSFETTCQPSFLLENFVKDTDSDMARGPQGTLLGPSRHVDRFVYGKAAGRGDPVYGPSTASSPRPPILAPGGKYPVIPAPTYADKAASDFINVKDPEQNGGNKVHGDDTADDAAALNAVLKYAAKEGRIAYFPFGNYRVESTVVIPPGSRIVGEAWATISGSGAYFKDETKPRPVVSVGEAGDVGVAQMQDLRFTVADVLPGAIIVQFNMAGRLPGDVALWNSLITVGGTRGASKLGEKCRDPSKECKAALLGLHFTRDSSAYVENVWNWVADHVTEDFDGGTSIAAKAGCLVESTKATWLHALGSEHWWLYQLNLRRARNVMVSLLQAETNYDQGANAKQLAPSPWKPDVSAWGDPDFGSCAEDDGRCRMGFATVVEGGSDVYSYGSAAWAFFSGPGYQGCGGQTCQGTMHWIKQTPKNLQVFGLCSKDADAIVRLADGSKVLMRDGFEGSWPESGGLVGRYTP
ncbi:hypothetical protein L249_0320 [Ophiocordyceps polyrhachis-furcata BCC 54312]|uniref:Rhamnogalacturonase A/B/Epimerase-like pectate lyase domain-containing protein n=1 Tax=Ophiocordyceps polyrhachis-furcata BCC 54312 TaxID=1330021 RepID=A0A367LFY9_9HYPO|nr:hypothetical protein L249_0320 [Ophiocordyceps polyrhachis-furcata BCC 54312]